MSTFPPEGAVECHCGYWIVWREYPPLPFPEVATERQLALQEKGGRWVHPEPDGGFDEWCPRQKAYPAKKASTTMEVEINE